MLIYLIIGTVLMAAIMFFCRRDYEIPVWKTALFSALLTVIGVTGVKLMYFIENGDFSGLSFFGAVFFIPPLVFPIALALRVSHRALLDLSAPAVAAMLCVMKVNCIEKGCCRGRVLFTDGSGAETRFPSQIFEMVTAAIIAALLVYAIKKKVFVKLEYPLLMIFYGASRFVLNFFRETTEFFFGMGIGNMWSVIAVLVGVAWLICQKKIEAKHSDGAQTE